MCFGKFPPFYKKNTDSQQQDTNNKNYDGKQ